MGKKRAGEKCFSRLNFHVVVVVVVVVPEMVYDEKG